MAHNSLRWWLTRLPSLFVSKFSGFIAAHLALVALSVWLAAPLTIASLTCVAPLLWVGSTLIGLAFGRRLDLLTLAGGYFDGASGAPLLKEWYDDQKVEILAYDDNPLLVMLPKKTNATGRVIPVPIIYELNQGRSSSFSIAQTNQTAGQFGDFLLPLRPDYDVATLGNQAMKSAGDDRGAFMDFATLHVDMAIMGASNSQASSVFRAGTGTIAQISSITGGGVITLSNLADVSQFGINQVVQANPTDGGSPRAALGYVTARDVMGGTVTISATTWFGPAGAPSGWAANDFLLVQGDNNAKLAGLTAWLPSTKPGTTDNFFNVNRSPDSRLYGLFYNGAQQPHEEALIDAAMVTRREKGRPKHFFTNYGSLSSITKAMGTRREYVDWKGEGEIGFTGLRVIGPAGPIECYADRNCQAATGFLLQMNVWKLYSLGPVPHIFKYKDEIEMLRSANADAMELRVGAYSQLGCAAPGWNSQVALAS